MGNEYPSDYSGWHQAEPSGIPMNDLEPFEIEMLRAEAQRQHQQKGSERIDLKQFEGLDIGREMMHFQSIIEEVPNLIAELKRCYDLLDRIAVQAIPDNEDPELYGYVIGYELIKSITEAFGHDASE